MPNTTHDHATRNVPTRAALQFTSELYGFLEGAGLTIEDAQETIRQSIVSHDGAATPDEITNHFIETHMLRSDDAPIIMDLAVLLAYGGTLQRIAHGKYSWNGRTPTPKVIALVSIPTAEWDRFRPYVNRGRPVWMLDEEMTT